MSELPILGLRVGKEVSSVHQQIKREELLAKPDDFLYKDRKIEDIWESLQHHLQLDLLDLFDFFHLDRPDFMWRQLYHQNALSAVFIGSLSKNPFNIMQAQATLEVISKIYKGKVEPQELALGVVIPDSKGIKRIVAVGYDLGSRVRQRIGVSLSIDEIPEIGTGYDQDTRGDYKRSFKPIPNTNSFYRVRAFIPQEMIRETENHQFLLEAWTTDEKASFDHWLVEQVGFCHSLIDKTTSQIGFQTEWSIKYPSSL